MKNLSRCYILSLGLLPAGLFAQTTPSSAAPADGDQVVVLPSFKVDDTKDKGYLAGNSVSATRINTPISDLPFAISAFTSQFISDIGARDLWDVVKFSASVQNGSTDILAGNTNYLIRGFNQSPEHDGFYESGRGNVYVDTADVERVEVVKGPASLLYGIVSPGGTVNYITKQAQPTAFVNLSAAYGSFDYARTTLDYNQPIVGETLMFRLNAAWENGFEYVDPGSSKTRVIDPTVTWNIVPGLKLRVNYQYFHRDETPGIYPLPQLDVATPASVVASLYTAGYPGPSAALTGKTGIDVTSGFGSDGSNPGQSSFYSRFPKYGNYTSANDNRHTDLQSIDVELDATLGKHWNSRFNFDFNHSFETETITGQSQIYMAPPDSLTYSGGKWSVAPAWAALSAAQQLATELAFATQMNQEQSYFPTSALQTQNGTQAPAIIPRRGIIESIKDNNKSFQEEFAGDYNWDWLKFKPVVGIFYDENYSRTREVDNLGTAASPYYRSWDIDPLSPTYYIDQTTTVPVNTLSNNAADTLGFSSDQALYGIVNAELLNSIYVVGGARYNASQSQTTNFANANVAARIGTGYRAHDTTPTIGMGYKLTKDVLLYASYATAYSLPGTGVLNTIQNINGVLQAVPTTQAVPVTSVGYEAGVKTNFLNGRISSTLSVYDIKQKNVVQSIVNLVGGQNLTTQVQQTEVASKGVEFETTLSPFDNWQIFISASEDDIRNVEEPAGFAYFLGESTPYASKTLVNVWSRYTFIAAPFKGLWVGAGLNYNSRMALDNINASGWLPGNTIYSMAAGYDWIWNHKKLSAKLNFDNIADTFYVVATQERGLPRRVVGSLSLGF